MSSYNLPSDTPQGYILEQSLIHGKSKTHPGVFEIKFHILSYLITQQK